MNRQSTNPERSTKRGWRRPPRWVVGGAVTAAVVIVLVAASIVSSFRADERYRAAVAEADRSDPGWRSDALVAKLQPIIADADNSALKVTEISSEIGDLPLQAQVAVSQLLQGETTARLDAIQAAKLRSEQEPLAGALAKARLLADLPGGRYPGARPAVTTLELVPNSNLLRTVPYYAPEVDAIKVVSLLGRDVILRADAADCGEAVRSIRAMINVGRSLGDEPSRQAQEVRSRISGLATQYLLRVLVQGEVAEPALAALQKVLEDEDAEPGLLTALRGDRAALDEMLSKVISGKLSRNAIPGVARMPTLVRFLLDGNTLHENRTHILEQLNALVEAARLPDGDRETQVEALLARFTDERRGRSSWTAMRHSLEDDLLLSAYANASRWRIFAAERRAAIVAIAAERYRRVKGRWPETLGDLVPVWLKRVPNDPFANGPLRIRRLPDGVFIYSVGYDLRDDGGKYDPRDPVGRDADAGFRLWDVGKRFQPAKSVAKNGANDAP